MIFSQTPIPGLTLLRTDAHRDPRGAFARWYCRDEFAAHDIDFSPSQISISSNTTRHTLRGLHWQEEPHAEAKLVRVTSGRIFDVAVDLRSGSPTRLRWFGVELAANDGKALFIPAGFAHGMLTLTDNADLLYMIDTPYAPDSARGARWDDPAIGIAWPTTPEIIGDRDLAWPLLSK